MKMFRKSQAAMEFLMTYGWAILVVLVAIGALAYFGVLDPAQFLPERCTGPAGMDCVDRASVHADVAGAGYIELAVKNSLGFDIIVLDQTYPVAGTYAASAISGDFGTPQDGAGTPEVGGIYAKTAANGATPGTAEAVPVEGLAVDNGDYLKIRMYSDTEIDDGKFKGDFTFWYKNADTGLDHPVTYNVVGKAI